MNPDTSVTPGRFAATDLDCLLTLAMPNALQDEVLDLLLQQTDLVPGCSVLQGHGMGPQAPLNTAMERVQGRAQRVFVQIVLRSPDVAPLLTRLREAVPSPLVVYWAVPLQAFGSLA